MERLKQTIWKNITALREEKPLVYNITNIVAANLSANALLAAGASPVMSCAEEEAGDLVRIAGALVLNTGTPDRNLLPVMALALKEATRKGIPVVLDPVGAGATAYRTGAARQLLGMGGIRFLRGNTSEIMALAECPVTTRGVDSSTTDTHSALLAALEVSQRQNCIVSVSGPTDVICGGGMTGLVDNGSPLMPMVSGLGCTSTALLAAFAAVERDPFTAALSAAAFLAVCGELAAAHAAGPGSLPVHLLDLMHSIDETTFKATCRVRCGKTPLTEQP